LIIKRSDLLLTCPATKDDGQDHYDPKEASERGTTTERGFTFLLFCQNPFPGFVHAPPVTLM